MESTAALKGVQILKPHTHRAPTGKGGLQTGMGKMIWHPLVPLVGQTAQDRARASIMSVYDS